MTFPACSTYSLSGRAPYLMALVSLMSSTTTGHSGSFFSRIRAADSRSSRLWCWLMSMLLVKAQPSGEGRDHVSHQALDGFGEYKTAAQAKRHFSVRSVILAFSMLLFLFS